MASISLHLRRLLSASFWLGSSLLLLFIAACGERATPTILPPLQPTATMPAEVVPSQTASPSANDQLLVWLPAFTGLAGEGSAGSTLTNAFHQFEQHNPAVQLDIQVKAENGTAGLLNFLRSAQQVAPSILPDLVLIDTQQLWQIADLGLVTALNEEERLPAADFFPVARAAVLYRTETIGIPYVVEVTHLVYDGDEMKSPPGNWTELLAGDHLLLFPAAESGTTNVTLLHYVGAGGDLLEDGGISDPAVLEQFFAFLAEAHEQGVIPASVLDMPGFNSVWRAYTEDRTEMAAVQVAQFYPNATGIKPPSYALVPTQSGASITIADTWAFAILTQDAQRRHLALALVAELLAPEVQGPWSQSVAYLPSRTASLALWTQPDDYRDFVQDLLADATAPPNGPAFADFARRLQAAQAGILRGELTVEAAMESMLTVE
ncbi:MAG: extracellular solute-binding protein [Caldilineaceae bacterium]|nr:extracellular solute-binding protein [Caldilineaceae bacterium]